MTGLKRTSPDSETSTLPSKVAKINDSDGPSKGPAKKAPKKGGEKAVKAAIPVDTFTSTALPLHVNLTHTPPTIADPYTEAVSVASVDPGFIGNVTLVPSTFSTGSFGWKGNKRITVELQGSEGDQKEKVQVMLSINATVVGSKPKAGENDDVLEAEDGSEPSEESRLAM
ncbi:hypothetical protein H0H87_012524 [Tephrocybe sp. NHM501043]|nr:hypothetical protein H0H87_012524 [Tephrocybe sp. NHM501043]